MNGEEVEEEMVEWMRGRRRGVGWRKIAGGEGLGGGGRGGVGGGGGGVDEREAGEERSTQVVDWKMLNDLFVALARRNRGWVLNIL